MIAALLTLFSAAPQWVPTFTQDFEGPVGTAPDAKVWTRDLGGGGFGNGEVQSYTDGPANAFLDGNGNLVIEARKEPTKGADGIARDYSSARLKTKERFSQAYGRIEARMKLPRGQGIWPAFWMLGDSISKVGWPTCGEIDIMEYLGHQPNIFYGTLHGPGYSGSAGIQGKYQSPIALSDAFHTFGIIWSPEKIDWTLDGKIYFTQKSADMKGRRWVFDDPHFLILNLAVGGGWPGYPDATTVFPQRLVVDFVHVFRDKNLVVDRARIDAAHRARIQRSQEYKPGPPTELPGTIVAADYRPGGYFDTDKINQGGDYRPLDGVDIGGSGQKAPKYSIGYTHPGEWMEYEVNVKKAGTFQFEIDVAADGPGGQIQLESKGKPLFPAVTVPSTGGWTAWKTIPMGRASLPKGRHTLRLKMLSASPAGTVGNILQIRVTH